MAIGLQNLPNTDGPSSGFPDGSTRDNDGSKNGTPNNKLVRDDYHQFFARLMREANIVPNGLPENDNDGHQYVDALKTSLDEFGWTSSGINFDSGFGNNADYVVQYRKIGRKVEWRGIAVHPTGVLGGSKIFSVIPTSLVPIGTSKHMPVGLGQAGDRAGAIEIRAGEANMRLFHSNAATQLFVNFDGVSYYV